MRTSSGSGRSHDPAVYRSLGFATRSRSDDGGGGGGWCGDGGGRGTSSGTSSCDGATTSGSCVRTESGVSGETPTVPFHVRSCVSLPGRRRAVTGKVPLLPTLEALQRTPGFAVFDVDAVVVDEEAGRGRVLENLLGLLLGRAELWVRRRGQTMKPYLSFKSTRWTQGKSLNTARTSSCETP